MKKGFAGFLSAAIAILTSAANAASNDASLPPPYAGAYQPVGVDEIGKWREADEDELVLANSPIVIRDEALNSYVRQVLCTAVGDDRCKATRIYIMRVPVFNASMTPNGTMRVYSGLLLRMRNEAELATILGHEFGHFEQRHTLNIWKAQRSATDLLSWAQVFAALGNSYQSYSNFNDMELSVYGRLYRFGRDQEREADSLGLKYLNGSKLRPQSASAVWQNLIEEQEASALAKGVKKPNFNKVAFFASHPPEGERAATLAALADPAGVNREDGASRYTAALAPWLPGFLDDQIKLNDFGASDHIISALAVNGWTAPLLVARGDLYRARSNPRDLVLAAEFYGKAVELDSSLPEAQRGLGLSMIKTGRRTEGQVALRRYLELKPNASDAAMISMLAPAAGGQ
ncbi:M48 family metalloprotease [Sphingobium sp. 3R8]|uniref:M48 family metallopeptidase n=1 Tax=Sphingobium sp. 3R8 TaxID=2874921 RepID=UPI001CCAA1C5|nr:M48 family metallopeptidase [Sphingobium sp. 3R8]MBZ9647080.1 M48 family metalloprotease [Sphingobium sp. 3R8]